MPNIRGSIDASTRWLKFIDPPVIVETDLYSTTVVISIPNDLGNSHLVENMSAKIKFQNGNKEQYVYNIVEKVLGEDGTVTLYWHVTTPATDYYGPVIFTVCLEETSDNNVTYRWNSSESTIMCYRAIQASQTSPSSSQVDTIAALIQQINTLSQDLHAWVLSGTEYPTNSTGEDNSLYLQTSGNSIIRVLGKVNGVWLEFPTSTQEGVEVQIGGT